MSSPFRDSDPHPGNQEAIRALRAELFRRSADVCKAAVAQTGSSQLHHALRRAQQLIEKGHTLFSANAYEAQETLLEGFEAATQGKRFQWRAADPTARDLGVSGSDTAALDAFQNSTVRMLGLHQLQKELDALDTPSPQHVRIADDADVITAVRRIAGPENATHAVVSLPSAEPTGLRNLPDDYASCAEQIQRSDQQYRTLNPEALPEHVAIFSVGTTTCSDIAKATQEMLAAVREAAPGAEQITLDAPENPWSWSSRSPTESITGALRDLGNLTEALPEEQRPDCMIARKDASEPFIEPGQPGTPTPIFPEDLGAPEGSQWFNHSPCWNKLEELLQAPRQHRPQPASDLPMGNFPTSGTTHRRRRPPAQ